MSPAKKKQAREQMQVAIELYEKGLEMMKNAIELLDDCEKEGPSLRVGVVTKRHAFLSKRKVKIS